MTEYEYNKGDIISIKAVVREHRVVNGSDILTVSRVDRYGGRVNFDIPASEVDRKLAKPIPEEPPRESILRDANGRLYTWRGTGGWYGIGVGDKCLWGRHFYEAYGPFEVFNPERTI